jgi:hypothetical protein
MRRGRFLIGLMITALIGSVTAARAPTVAHGSGGIMLTPISTAFNNPVGIDHHGPSNKVIMSVNYPSGAPYNFELVASDGTRTGFSTVHGLTDELKIATAKDDGGGMSMGGFPAGTIFSGTGAGGHILRISPDGATVWNPWVVLPGENGLLRGSLYVDRTGIWGGDLIVVTTAGGVWRVNAAGTPTKLAQINTHLEGLSTIPNDPRYGPWAGAILIGAEDQGRFYAIAPTGAITPYAIGIAPEDIDMIPANQNFFAVGFGEHTLYGAPASAFTGMVGDLLVTQEFGSLWHVWWDGAGFRKEQLATKPQFEHVTFSPAGVVEIPPACPDGLTWKAPLSGTTATNLPAGGTLPIVFSLCSAGHFVHDESVIVQVQDRSNPDYPVTTWVYGWDVQVDDAAMEYREQFVPGYYALTPGSVLDIQVYIGGSLAGQAEVHIT